MSGFEAVGVVLGSLPLIISGIEHYADVVRTFKRAIKYEIELRNLKHAVMAENIIFMNTLERVLEAAVPANQLEVLLKDPDGPLWKDSTLKSQLEEYLGNSFGVFKHSMTELMSTIMEFRNRLDLDKDGRVRWTEKTGLKLALKRASLSLQKQSYEDLIGDLQKHNRYLSKFVKRSIELEPSRRRRKHASKLRALGDYASSIFHALEKSLGCTCPTVEGHTALFKLTPRPQPRSSRVTKKGDTGEFEVVICRDSAQAISNKTVNWYQLGFKLTAEDPKHSSSTQAEPSTSTTGCGGRKGRKHVRFSHPNIIHQVGSLRLSVPASSTVTLQPVATSATQTNSLPSNPIGNTYVTRICRLLCASSQDMMSHCSGYVFHDPHEFFLQTKDQSPTPGQPRDAWSAVPLRQILRHKTKSVPTLTPWDRISLAAMFSTSVFQLHGSPWLEPCWYNDNVLFLQGKTSRLYKQVFVAKSIPSSHLPSPNHSAITIVNETLLALATVLVELSLGPLEELQTPEDLQSGNKANLVTLCRLITNGEVEVAFGPSYQAAVRRCIELAKSSTSFDDQIQQDLYSGVVSVLEAQANLRDSTIS